MEKDTAKGAVRKRGLPPADAIVVEHGEDVVEVVVPSHQLFQ